MGQDDDDELSKFTDPTLYTAKSDYQDVHDRGTFRSLHSKLPLRQMPEPDLTEKFFQSLFVKIPDAAVILKNIFVIGGPGTGKTTTARSIGFNVAKLFPEGIVQCLECNYLPDALAVIDPAKKVYVINIDDPLREQDARKPSEARAIDATNSFLEIRHIVMKEKLVHQAKEYLGLEKLPSETERFLIGYHDSPKILRTKFPEHVIKVSGIIYTIFGPQVPTIDNRLHMSKIWEIYKGFGAMDQLRRRAIKSELNKFWIERLGQNEWKWRGLGRIEYMNKAVIKNTMTEEIGWLHLPLCPNIFTFVEQGAKRKQIAIKNETELLDEWSQWIYDNMGLLQPSYSPIDRKEKRYMALRNLIRDIYRRNIDPRTYQELSSPNQKFLEKGLKGGGFISSLDDRIIKIHTLKSSDTEKIEFISERLLTEMEKTDISPASPNASRMIRHIARKIFPDEDGFMDKKGIWKKIYDQFVYQWHELYPKGKGFVSTEPSDEGGEQLSIPTVDAEEHGREIIEARITEEQERGDSIEFNITEEEIINILLQRHQEYQSAAEVFMHGNGICGRARMTNKEIYETSNTPGSREEQGFTESFISVDAVKYRRKQFSGLFSQELGFLFETWIETAIEQGYQIPNVLEGVIELQHAKRGTVGQPDFIFKHANKSKTVASIKIYKSDRSETIPRNEFNPELRALTELKERGETARLLIIFRNLGIEHMLAYRIYNNATDVPPNVTFTPTEANQVHFIRGERDG